MACGAQGLGFNPNLNPTYQLQPKSVKPKLHALNRCESLGYRRISTIYFPCSYRRLSHDYGDDADDDDDDDDDDYYDYCDFDDEDCYYCYDYSHEYSYLYDDSYPYHFMLRFPILISDRDYYHESLGPFRDCSLASVQEDSLISSWMREAELGGFLGCRFGGFIKICSALSRGPVIGCY